MLGGLKDGDYEILVRPKIDWNTSRMNRYFHGPVLGFIREQFKTLGHLYSKDQIKDMLKHEHGEKELHVLGKKQQWMPKSTSCYDRDVWTKFLHDTNLWSIVCFSCELPPSDQIE